MKRRLLTQMRRNWKSNFWITFELAIVLAVISCFASALDFFSLMRYSHTGYNVDDIYVAEFKRLPEDSPYYAPYDDNHSYITDRDMLVARLRENPFVEEIGIGNNVVPYNGSFDGMYLRPVAGTPRDVYHANVRTLSPEALKALRLTGLNGESPDRLAAVLQQGDVILSDISDKDTVDMNPRLLLGKEIYASSDSATVMSVGALAWSVPVGDYEYSQRNGVAYFPLPRDSWASEIVIRTKPGRGAAFTESLSAADKEFGNVLITDLCSIDVMRDRANTSQRMVFRIFCAVAFIILMVVFLGFLGTFWFRTQQRVGEIAMRKVAGATDRDIFIRLVSEGLLLLLVTAVIVVPLYVWFVRLAMSADMGFTSYDSFILHVALVGVLSAAAVLALLIVAAIWMPARKAMRIDPAVALKDL